MDDQPSAGKTGDDDELIPADTLAEHLLRSGRSQEQAVDEMVEIGHSRTHARHAVETTDRRLEQERQAEGPAGDSVPRAIVAGVAAAVVAGIAWGLLTWKAEFETGFAAWGVGLLVGYAVLYGTGHRKGLPLQVVAVLSSVLGILLGKYLTLYFVVRDQQDSDVSVFDPGLLRFMRDNAELFFGLFDLLFIGLAVYSAWRLLEPSENKLRRADA